MSQEIERELGWDDVIEKEGADFIILPAGDCHFEVTAFERGRFAGSDKLPACNKAVLDIKLTADDGSSTTIKHNLFLHSKTEGMLCSFFSAIGQRKKGEKLRMNWGKVVGSSGRCKIKIREWQSKDGNTMKNNEIQKFYDYDPDGFAPVVASPFQVGEF